MRHVNGDYLLMRRDPRKAHGGMWEASAGGAAQQGEGALEARWGGAGAGWRILDPSFLAFTLPAKKYQ